jgi:hypothetical protein
MLPLFLKFYFDLLEAKKTAFKSKISGHLGWVRQKKLKQKARGADIFSGPYSLHLQ